MLSDCDQVFQALEGPRDKVESLFDLISADSRHSSISVSKAGAITERVHSTWMGKCCVEWADAAAWMGNKKV